MPLTLDYLKEQLLYKPEEGLFFWNVRKNGRQMGKPVGSRTGVHGSIKITIDGVVYYGNRLAWYYMTGCKPDYLGYKDFNPLNLKWNNLEQISKQEYHLRIKAMIPSPIDGIRPVVKSYTTGQWYLQQREGSNVIKGPYYDDPREAVHEWARINEVKVREFQQENIRNKTIPNGRAKFGVSELKQALKDYKYID